MLKLFCARISGHLTDTSVRCNSTENSPEKLTFTQLVTTFHSLPSNHVSFSIHVEDSMLTDEATGERGKLVRKFTANSKWAGIAQSV
jgi:hypothetical protein